ncbi:MULTISPECIES: hypothetical protein [Deinococcus]|uniref:Uncharacterized protein n=1 Tax=Deinococcus rufus TaxID=2136097 RepID=A0ABV7Z6Q7_9DEIO|nr:hypothetical protein [Deinococcus sp. AB2017081]WQE94757.1 hypothetical protein U2P90_15390 [Deinococcus sp. AB2017081]
MTRAPVNLSREMKLLLLLLLMVGLIGLWYVLTNKPATTELSQQPPATGTAGTGGGTTPATGGTDVGNPDAVPVATPDTASPDASGPALDVQPDSQVQVETIPPFPTDDVVTETPAPEPVVPDGINPDGVIAATPGINPFKPLSLDQSATAATNTRPSTPAPVSTTDGAVTASVPARPVAPQVDSLGQGGGALGLSPIPGAAGSVDVESGSVSGGALPVPVIPGADGSAGTAATPVVVPVTPNGQESGSAVVAGQNPTGTVVLTPPAPVKPPVVGMTVPGTVTRLPDAAPAATPSGATQGAAGATTSGSGLTATAVPTPSTPQLIRELGAGSTGTGPVTATSALDRYVSDQNLVFNAVVLGPINTAIFRSKAGYVVVASGQPLPDSNVTVGTVTATSATLNLGTESTTLELDKR